MRALALAPILVVIVACSHNESIQAEATGATGTGGHRMQGAGGSTASANGAGGSGAGSCCSEPVHVAGRVKTVSADTDADQLVSGTFGAGKIISGPFVLTDAHGDNGLIVSLVSGTSCANSVPRETVAGGTEQHGMRIFVPAGSSLCGDYAGNGAFSGFRPY